MNNFTCEPARRMKNSSRGLSSVDTCRVMYVHDNFLFNFRSELCWKYRLILLRPILLPNQAQLAKLRWLQAFSPGVLRSTKIPPTA